jgi:uncharacterized protein
MMDKRIIEFIKGQTCSTICCVEENTNPHCFSCLYLFNPADGLLYFKSSPDSFHMKLIKLNPQIAGTILPDKLNKLMLKGIQLQGQVLEQHHPLANGAAVNYYKKYPIAMAIKGGSICHPSYANKNDGERFGDARKDFMEQE